MSAVKRVQKLLRQAEKRATAPVNIANGKVRDRQRLGELARSGEQLCREEVYVKATGRAMEKALSVGRWFEEGDRVGEYTVRVKTGSVLVVDDVVEDEEAKAQGVQEQEKGAGGEEMDRSGDGEAAAAAEATDKAPSKPRSKTAAKKRKRAANAAALMAESELPETRTRWVNMVEVAVALK